MLDKIKNWLKKIAQASLAPIDLLIGFLEWLISVLEVVKEFLKALANL